MGKDTKMKGKILAIISKISEGSQKLQNRFLEGGGFMKLGFVQRNPRSNTTKELTNSIRAYAKENPEIANFAKHIDEMNPKHLGLAQDIIDLSNTKELSMTNIDLGQKIQDGTTYAGYMLKRLPEISKKNPEALDLTEEVINNSDTQNAKFFLSKLFGYNLENMSSISEQMKATKEVVPEVAKSTLEGGYTGDFSKNNQFFTFIQTLCSGDSKPENIKLLKPIFEMMDKINKNTGATCDIEKLRTAETKIVKDNMDALPYLLENAEAQGKTIDVTDFLTKAPKVD